MVITIFSQLSWLNLTMISPFSPIIIISNCQGIFNLDYITNEVLEIIVMKKLVIAALLFLVVTISCYRAESALAVPQGPEGDNEPKVTLQCDRHGIGPEFKICTGRIAFEGRGGPYEIYWKDGSQPWSSTSGTANTYTSTRRLALAQNPIQFQVEDRIGTFSNIASASCESTGGDPVIP